jgi:hypothetical protein
VSTVINERYLIHPLIKRVSADPSSTHNHLLVVWTLPFGLIKKLAYDIYRMTCKLSKLNSFSCIILTQPHINANIYNIIKKYKQDVNLSHTNFFLNLITYNHNYVILIIFIFIKLEI